MLDDVAEILASGGPVMAPIIAVSVTAWTIVFLRLFSVKREGRELGEFLWRLEGRLRGGGRVSALDLCRQSATPMALLVSPLLAKPSLSRMERRRLIQRAVESARGWLGRHLPLLAVLAGAATLFGLLGTVAGMIRSFGVVELHGTGEPALLSVGVSQALITTEAGLVVALPLLLMHSYLSSRVDAVSIEAERKLLEISAGMRREVGG